MKSRSFIILLIVLIVIGSGTMYSCVLVGDPHDKFHKIKRELYVRGNTASVSLELDKDAYLLQIRHETAPDRYQETYFNATKLTANVAPYTRISDNIECSYMHIPSEMVNQGKNTIEVIFAGNPPPKIDIKLTNYRKQISEEMYFLFSDASHVRASKILSIDVQIAGILILLFSIMVYLQVRWVPAGENKLSSLSRIYLLVVLCINPVLSCLGRIGSYFGYRVAVTPFRFWSLVAIFVAPFFAIKICSFKSEINGQLMKERKFDLKSATFFVILIVLVNLWVYWPSFSHLFRHDEWFLFFSSKEETPNLHFIAQHIDWQLKLPYDRLNFRPIFTAGLAVNRVLFDTNYVGPHILTFLKHITATFLLWIILWRMKKKWISVLFALLFSLLMSGVDPVAWPHVDAYITVTIFILLAMLIFDLVIDSRLSPGCGLCLLSIFIFLGLLTTQLVLVAPFVFLITYRFVYKEKNGVGLGFGTKPLLLSLFGPLLLWAIFFLVHLYYAYPFNMTSQSSMVSLWKLPINICRFLSLTLTSMYAPVVATASFGDKVYINIYGGDFFVIFALFLIFLLRRTNFIEFRNKRLHLPLLMVFFTTGLICSTRASYMDILLSRSIFPSYYAYSINAMLIIILYKIFDFHKTRVYVLVLMALLCLVFAHGLETRSTVDEISKQTEPLKKYYDAVSEFVSQHKNESDFSFKIIDRPPKIQVFTWYHETCIDGLFCRFINNETPKYLLEYDYEAGNLQYSLYDQIPTPVFYSIPSRTIPEGADYVNSVGIGFKEVPGPKCDVLLGMFEVTQKQWKDVMGFNPSRFKHDHHPVENVSYNMAQRFIARLNEIEGGEYYRLPTEEEYSHWGGLSLSQLDIKGHDITQYAWLRKHSAKRTRPVGERFALPPGFYDLLGNVWEWTGSPIHFGSEVGPRADTPRICFGGSWREDHIRQDGLETDYPTDFRHEHLGFRLIREANGLKLIER